MPKSRKPTEPTPSAMVAPGTNVVLRNHPEHARLLGCIISQSALIENLFVFVLTLALEKHWNLIHPMLYTITGSKARLDALGAAYDVVFKGWALLPDLRAALKRANALTVERNKYAHPRFAISADGSLSLMNMKRFGTATEVARLLPPEELESVLARMDVLTSDVMALLGRVLIAVRGRVLPPSEGEQSSQLPKPLGRNDPWPPGQPPPSPAAPSDPVKS